jgi:hypothetical protein
MFRAVGLVVCGRGLCFVGMEGTFRTRLALFTVLLLCCLAVSLFIG